ncbi:20546_t:CDS:2 [Dentiscutata erythropus]|uniref:20546_t:CDS:1 n=1 Tax=Dentiscutata erythropus TaxID=1348616 RepID=A0A9N9NJ41_9GLOM|nr:20546_t:CDS:2 [Dentiscutata erythropus]
MQNQERHDASANCQKETQKTAKEPLYLSTQENLVAQKIELEEVEVFRAIAQEYFLGDSDEELEIIPWENNTTEWIEEEYENKISSSDEYITYEWEEELTNNEIERKRCYQNLLTELTLEIRIEITWSIINGYQNKPTNSNNIESELPPTNLDEAYLVDIPQWGELTEGLEFQDSSDEEYEDTGYEDSDWPQEFDDYIDWEYYDSQMNK